MQKLGTKVGQVFGALRKLDTTIDFSKLIEVVKANSKVEFQFPSYTLSCWTIPLEDGKIVVIPYNDRTGLVIKFETESRCATTLCSIENNQDTSLVTQYADTKSLCRTLEIVKNQLLLTYREDSEVIQSLDELLLELSRYAF
ncbi:MAG: hypothetical protein NZT61_02565 [Deltaproteobacteria bacterium]|nr:hypothetical protein [Deltaproteobacteria bacterium]